MKSSACSDKDVIGFGSFLQMDAPLIEGLS
jgi:hypothetical protein